MQLLKPGLSVPENGRLPERLQLRAWEIRAMGARTHTALHCAATYSTDQAMLDAARINRRAAVADNVAA